MLPYNSARRKIAAHIKDVLRPSRRQEQLSYQEWIEKIEPGQFALPAKGKYRPLISIVVPAYNTPDKYLVPLIDSVISQTYGNWELVLVQASTDARRAKSIRRSAERDKRIALVEMMKNEGIAGNTNAGIKAAKGEYIGFLDHDDTLAKQALNEIVSSLQYDPTTDWFYSDEDKLSDDGKDRLPYLFKPDWSPDLFMNVNYVTHFSVVRTDLVRRVGGIHLGFDGSQDFDFALRLLDHKPVVKHIPKILYHWRMADGSTSIHPDLKSSVEGAGIRALNDYLKRNKIRAKAEGVPDAPSNYHVRYEVPSGTLVSLIIPFKDKAEVTKVMVDSILAKTEYKEYEIILIDNRSDEPATVAYLKTLKNDVRIKILTYDKPFNWSAVNNFGRLEAKGNVLVFLNNDMEVINGDWLGELTGVALQSEVGEVGALLYYPDMTIQHAGVVVGLFGVAGHVFRGRKLGEFRLFGLADWPRNYLAVTGACVAVEARKFDHIGGFDENFQTAGSDVAFGIRLHEAGYRNVYWPFAKLLHYENVSVGVYNERRDTKHDYEESMKYYRRYIDNGDPYYNPNLELMAPGSEQIKLKGSNNQ
jgi:glycosyltransferase involved in cell wall biosynthesis